MEEKPVSMEWLLDEVWGRQKPGERNLKRVSVSNEEVEFRFCRALVQFLP